METRERDGVSYFTADATRELKILGHDRGAFVVEGAEIHVLEQGDEVCLAGFLQRQDGGTLKSQVAHESLCDLAHKVLERKACEAADRSTSGSAGSRASPPRPAGTDGKMRSRHDNKKLVASKFFRDGIHHSFKHSFNTSFCDNGTNQANGTQGHGRQGAAKAISSRRWRR
jgi:hypothetical protein